jgi:hypothetical protein
MIANIPPEITIASFSLVGMLTGYVWNDQNKRICKIEEDQNALPIASIHSDIAQMKTDIDWIKKYLIKN